MKSPHAQRISKFISFFIAMGLLMIVTKHQQTLANTSYPSCDIVSNFTSSATSGDSGTQFTFQGKIHDCTSTNVYVYLNIQSPKGSNGKTLGDYYFVTTDSNGAFIVTGLMADRDSGKSMAGTWTVTLTRPQANNTPVIDASTGHPASIAISISDATKPVPCGTQNLQRGTVTCADSTCPIQHLTDGTWACESNTQHDQTVTDIANGCSDFSTITTSCDISFDMTPVYSCDSNSTKFSCKNGSKICFISTSTSTTPTVDTIRCQTTNSSSTHANDNNNPPPFPPCVTKPKNGHLDGCTQVNTVFGVIGTDPQSIIKTLLGIFLSLSGGIALLMIIRSGYQLITSRGNAEKIKEAQDRIISAVVGLIFSIFSLVVLEAIGVDILHIPGLGH